MLMPEAVALALFPARSVLVPVTACALPSVLSVVGAGQLTMPEPDVPLLAFLGSVQVNATLTAVLFQQAALGAGNTLLEIVGAVSSMLTTTGSVAVLVA